jgi:L-lysine 2,3-aminomutase
MVERAMQHVGPRITVEKDHNETVYQLWSAGISLINQQVVLVRRFNDTLVT